MSLKKTIGKTIGIIALVIVIIAAAAWVAVHTGPVNHYLLGLASRKASTALGASVHIGSMQLAWTQLSVKVRNITIEGPGGTSNPPFATVQEADAGVELGPLFHKKVYLSFLQIQNPVVHFLVDTRGNSNLPHPPPSRGPRKSTVTTLLNLQVRDFRLLSGEIYYHNKKIPLSAELHNLRSKVAFDSRRDSYAGSMAYDSGRVAAKGVTPVENKLAMEFALSNSQFDVHPLRVQFGRSNFSASARLSHFASPVLEGRFEGDLFAGDLSAIFPQSGGQEMQGEILTSGKLNYKHTARTGFLDSIAVKGEFRSAAFTYGYRNIAEEVRELHGFYELANGDLHAWNVAGEVLGGSLSGNFEIMHLAHSPVLRITSSLRGADLARLTQLAEQKTGKRVPVQLEGAADISFEATGHGASDLRVHARSRIQSTRNAVPQENEIPVSGLIDVNYAAARDVASFGRSWLTAGSTRVVLAGTLGRRAQLQVNLNTTDLHQLTQMAEIFSRKPALTHASGRRRPSPSASSFDIETLGGAAQFKGAISGSLKAPQIRGAFTAEDFHVDDMTWRTAGAQIDVSPSHAAFQNGRLANGSKTRVNFHGEIGLQHWSFSPSSKIQLSASLAGIPVAEIERLLNRHDPVSGTLDADTSITGTRDYPSGNGNFQITRMEAWGEPVKSLTGNFHLSEGTLSAAAQANTVAGNISGKLNYTLASKTFQANFDAREINLSQIQSSKVARLGLAGMLSASAKAHGTVAQPQASATISVQQFVIRGESVSQAQADIHLSGRRMDFTLTAGRQQEQARVKGNVVLAGNFLAHATLDVRALALGPMLAAYASSAREVKGQMELHATADGPLKNLREMRARVSIPTFNLSYDSERLSLAHPLIAEYANGVATIQPTELKGTGTELKIQGRIPVEALAAATLSVNGQIDLAALRLLGPGVKSSGKVEIQIEAHGMHSLADSLSGQIRIENASLFTSNIPVGLENLNANLKITNGRVNIAEFAAKVGGGTLHAEGSLSLSRKAPFNVALKGSRIRVRYPAGVRSVLSANLQFAGTPAASVLSGRVTLERLSFTDQFDLSTIMGQFSGAGGESNPSRFAQHMKLNVSLQSARELQVASSQVSMAGTTNLNIVGTAADPVILGRMTLESGDIFFMGKRYEVQSGTITFSNPVHTKPVMNVYVTTAVSQYNITLNFVGPVERLRTNYTSVPPLSPSDIINLLAFGKTTEQAAAEASTPASVGAESLLAQGVGSAISGRLQNLTGLSQLSISPTVGGSQSGAGAQVALQERVTGSILVTFSTNVTAAQNTAVQVRYSITPSLFVSVLRDQNGGYALDFRVRRTF